MKSKIVVIAGPTASGKTRLAVSLAKQFRGEVISADSMQIYRGMNIGSAKPTEEEQEGIRHWMIDIAEPTEPFSVAEYVEMARAVTEDILSRGKLPILAGGTGLYLSSFVDNIRFTQAETDVALREKLFAEAEEKGNVALHQKLAEIDPLAAEKIHPNNVKRVVRALELYYSTGKTMSCQNEQSRQEVSPYEPLMLALETDREILYERINRRVDVMLENGLLREIAELKQRGMTAELQSMQGIGYKELLDCPNKEEALAEAVELVKKNSRNYAKRQFTWFRRDARYHWLDCMSEHLEEKAAELVRHFLELSQ